MSESNSEAPQSFEQALERLELIVQELEEGEVGLETSLVRFEEGIRLLKNCHQVLEQAERRIEILTGTDAGGNPVCAPFDARATVETSTGETSEQAVRKPGRRRNAARPAPQGEHESGLKDENDEKGLF
ncbi:MAG: exodeoxyribonuclease VII small subunit [Planctomycetaceae bacterium]